METPRQFPYDLAFDRNLGWITDWEQLALRSKRVAIAGMGGVGGVHLLTLARLGIGAFNIADLDVFEFANFNRQVGATVRTVGRAKVEALEEMALAINPELQIRRFDAGVTPANIDDFLAGADLFVDGFDFFVIDVRRQVFARAAELGIPAITAAPIGMGAAYLVFMPGHMSFETYFRLNGQSEEEQYLRFLVGLTPKGLHRRYLVDPRRVDLAGRKGPSTVAACQSCSGVVAAAALKVLLRRGNIMPAPYNHHFDAYRGRLAITRLPFGNAGPVQRLKLAIARRVVKNLPRSDSIPEPASAARTPIEEILNLARWAPSGSNAQPWDFEIAGSEIVRLHIRTDPSNIYQYRDCEPTWLAAGMLIETMRIAATGWQRTMAWQAPSAGTDTIPVHFSQDHRVSRDPLFGVITTRSTDRHAYRRRGLTEAEKAALASTLGETGFVHWHESLSERLRLARTGALSAAIMLRCPEAFTIQQSIIDWIHPLSAEGIPAGTWPLHPAILPGWRWTMQRWERARLLNGVGGAGVLAAHMDYAPIVASSALFDVRLKAPTAVPEDRRAQLLAIGGCLQRFWLTATNMGLAIQPLLAIVCVAHYGRMRVPFTRERGLLARSERLARLFDRAVGANASEVLFLGRIGEPFARLPLHRAVRRPIAPAK